MRRRRHAADESQLAAISPFGDLPPGRLFLLRSPRLSAASAQADRSALAAAFPFSARVSCWSPIIPAPWWSWEGRVSLFPFLYFPILSVPHSAAGFPQLSREELTPSSFFVSTLKENESRSRLQKGGVKFRILPLIPPDPGAAALRRTRAARRPGAAVEELSHQRPPSSLKRRAESLLEF